MHSLNDTALKSNKYMKINFNGGDLSSDAGLLLVKEFACRLGFDKILKSGFKTNGSAMFRIHKDDENLWQMVYQILGAYFEDDCADELTNDPVLTAVLGKVLSCKLDAPVPCRLDAPDFGFVCHVLADCLHQHQQVI